jgi:cob(I)alamin adenosyltransferase
METGKVHIYMGDGKGKTTAAFGLGLRACGCGLKVAVVQFLKTTPTGECAAVKHLPGFDFYRFESDHGFFWTLNDDQKEALKQEVQQAFSFCVKLVKERQYDVLILDEVLGALQNGLLEESALLDLMQMEKTTELVLTGRYAPSSLIARADYVTNMECIKHPYDTGCTPGY